MCVFPVSWNWLARGNFLEPNVFFPPHAFSFFFFRVMFVIVISHFTEKMSKNVIVAVVTLSKRIFDSSAKNPFFEKFFLNESQIEGGFERIEVKRDNNNDNYDCAMQILFRGNSLNRDNCLHINIKRFVIRGGLMQHCGIVYAIYRYIYTK